MLELEYLLNLRDYAHSRSREDWEHSPSDAIIRKCRSEAIERARPYGTHIAEAAALLFALSIDEGRMGSARGQLPVRATMALMRDHGLLLKREDWPLLLDVQDDIAAGMPWEEVLKWFEDRLVRR
jgi:hypothetical protein